MSMCNENVLTKVSYKFSNENEAKVTLTSLFKNLDVVYSYILYNTNENYTLNILISHDVKYNTVPSEYLINDVCKNIKEHKTGKNNVVTYKQATLEILVETLDNLVHSIVNEQYNFNKKEFEYEDLLQITRLKLCELYNKGYYIHKNLLRSTVFYYLNNLKNKRKYQKEPLSLDYITKSEGDDVSMYDTLEDKDYSVKLQDEEDAEFRISVLNLQKDAVMDIISERQYDRLLMEYGAKSTTSWSEKLVFTIKQKLRLKKEASTKQLLDKYKI